MKDLKHIRTLGSHDQSWFPTTCTCLQGSHTNFVTCESAFRFAVLPKGLQRHHFEEHGVLWRILHNLESVPKNKYGWKQTRKCGVERWVRFSASYIISASAGVGWTIMKESAAGKEFKGTQASRWGRESKWDQCTDKQSKKSLGYGTN